MSLLDRAKADIKTITTNKNDFAVDMTFQAPNGGPTKTIQGLHTKHHLGIDQEGNQVNSKTAQLSFCEKVLTDLGYPVRNSENEVDLNKHLISVKDSTDTLVTYVVQAWFPDETLGLIRVTLSDYNVGED